MKSILLSIIIPVYNVEKYIRTCLESVYSQNVEIDTFEVVIVNDGTPDNSMEIVNEYSIKYNNLIIINQENGGLSVARNSGLAIASGKYVWFVDSDDTIVFNCLSYIYEKINIQPEVDVFTSEIIAVDERTLQKVNRIIQSKEQIYLIGKDYLCRKNASFVPAQKYIISRNFLVEHKIQFTKGIYHEDSDFSVKMLCQAAIVYVMDRPIYRYLIRSSGSIMSSWKSKHSEDILWIYKELVAFRDKYVEERYHKYFNIVNFRILICALRGSKNTWHTQTFRKFYKANKTYIKKEARKVINFFEYGPLWNFYAICYSISPIIAYQVKFNKKLIIDKVIKLVKR